MTSMSDEVIVAAGRSYLTRLHPPALAVNSTRRSDREREYTAATKTSKKSPARAAVRDTGDKHDNQP